MAQFGVVYPLWSFAGEQDQRLARLIGEVGIDHITVPVITGPVTHFRFEPETGPHYFHTEGGWHYQPERERYGGTDIHPRTADWLKKSNPLPKLMELARRNKVKVLFRFDLRAWIASAHPTSEVMLRNAWDEPMAAAGPCVLHPGFRALFRGSIEDLLRLQPAGLELVNYSTTRWVDQDQIDYGPLKVAQTPALGACFCAACTGIAEASGHGASGLRRLAQLEVARLSRPVDSSSQPDELQSFVCERSKAGADYLARLTASLKLDGLPLFDAFGFGSWMSSMPPESAWTSLFILPRNDARRRLSRADWSGSPASRGKHALSVTSWRPVFGQSSDLVRFVTASVADGKQFLEFEDVDAAPMEVTTWIKQAVRFARRLGADA